MERNRPVKNIGYYLVEKLSGRHESLKKALEIQSDLITQGIHKTVGEICLEQGWIGEDDLAACLQKQREALLAAMELFESMPPETIAWIAFNSRHLIYPENTAIFEQFDEADNYYIVVSGKVLVSTKSGSDAVVPLATLGTAEGFGEMALLTGEPRSASVMTIERTSLIAIHRELFNELLVSCPAASRAFIRVLSERISLGNTKAVETYSDEKAYRRFITEQMARDERKIAGNSPLIRKLVAGIKSAAGSKQPALITGEPGTELWDAARLLHNMGKGSGKPLLSMDAKTVRASEELISDAGGESSRLELAQLTVLFGRAEGFFPFSTGKRLGLLQLVEDGTVIIENIDYLSPGAQAAIRIFVETGRFHPLGETSSYSSNARIIATSHIDLADAVNTGVFDEGLYDILSGRILEVPPLRKRKKDMKDIIRGLLDLNAGLSGKIIREIDEEAYQAIMAYDWPGNMEELNVVIRRAVSIAKDSTLAVEHIFIGPPPVTGQLSFNLMQVSEVGGMLKSKAFPTAVQLSIAPFIALIIALGFLGSQSSTKNIILILVWGFWEPLVVVSSLFAARIWCAVCPVGALSGLLSKLTGLKKRVPLFIRKHGYYFSSGGLALIFWSESASGMISSPIATSIFLSVIILLAVLTGLLFQRRAWCRYLCPLGGMVGVLSSCSVVELRSNYHICTNSCTKLDCYAGGQTKQGCPVFEAPFSLRSNQNCVLCGNCFKICPNNSPVLNLRPPGQELWTIGKTDRSTVVLGLVLISTQIFRGLEHAGAFSVIEIPRSQWWFFSFLFLAFECVLLWFLIEAAGKKIIPVKPESGESQAHLLVYALLPLAVAFETGFHLHRMLSLGPQFINVLGHQTGFSSGLSGPIVSSQLTRFFQLSFVLAGLIGSFAVLKRLIRKNAPVSGPVKISILQRCPALFLASLYVLLFIAW